MGKAGKTESEHAMIGWINADLAFQGLKAAGPSFDRRKVIDATNELHAFTADGLIAPIDWSRQHEPPTQDDPGDPWLRPGVHRRRVREERSVHGSGRPGQALDVLARHHPRLV